MDGAGQAADPAVAETRTKQQPNGAQHQPKRKKYYLNRL
jgi:hypothetical protein